jgi:hypothetical protein
MTRCDNPGIAGFEDEPPSGQDGQDSQDAEDGKENVAGKVRKP